MSCKACEGTGQVSEVHEVFGGLVTRHEACTACEGTGRDHAAQISAALERLRAAHPQWGWYVPKPGMIAGALEEGGVTRGIAAVYAAGCGWAVSVTRWDGDDWDSEDGFDADVVKAFEAARRAAGLEVTR